MNNRTMEVRIPKRVNTAFDFQQTDLIDRRRAPRTKDHPYLGRKRQREDREPIDWALCFMVAGAIFLVLLALLYKFTGPV